LVCCAAESAGDMFDFPFKGEIIKSSVCHVFFTSLRVRLRAEVFFTSLRVMIAGRTNISSVFWELVDTIFCKGPKKTIVARLVVVC
jgi:hypothetical protein